MVIAASKVGDASQGNRATCGAVVDPALQDATSEFLRQSTRESTSQQRQGGWSSRASETFHGAQPCGDDTAPVQARHEMSTERIHLQVSSCDISKERDAIAAGVQSTRYVHDGGAMGRILKHISCLAIALLSVEVEFCCSALDAQISLTFILRFPSLRHISFHGSPLPT
mmetsp:Transcript_8059/g.21803  ORF Transcript_8059/g.21803 Transcript_8059/m.21803 type:complete len:169 (+) Transcript_8059:542-1048(+)